MTTQIHFFTNFHHFQSKIECWCSQKFVAQQHITHKPFLCNLCWLTICFSSLKWTYRINIVNFMWYLGNWHTYSDGKKLLSTYNWRVTPLKCNCFGKYKLWGNNKTQEKLDHNKLPWWKRRFPRLCKYIPPRSPVQNQLNYLRQQQMFNFFLPITFHTQCHEY